MVRGSKQQRGGRKVAPRRQAADAGAAPEAAPRKATGSPLKVWIEEHWHGWLKSVSVFVVLGLAYVLYGPLNLIPEHIAGPLVIVAIVGGAIALSVIPAFQEVASQRRVLFGVFVAVWVIAAGFLPLRASLPRKILADRILTKDHLSDTISLPGESGPYEISVGGNLKGSGEAEAGYHLTITGDSKTGEEVSGTLARTFSSIRTGRRGGTSTVRTVQTELSHRLPNLRGQELQLQVDSVDDMLETGLHVSVSRAGFDPRIFIGLAILCAFLALFIDYRLASPKVKTYLTTAAGLLAVFAWHYPQDAHTGRLVLPAVGSFFTSLMTGGIGGMFAAWIARALKPMPKVKPTGRALRTARAGGDDGDGE